MTSTKSKQQFVRAHPQWHCLTHLFAQYLTLVLLLFAPTEFMAQKTEQPSGTRSAGQREEPGPDDVVRIDTDLVPVEVRVRNALGQNVRGLRVGDFKLFADEIQQPISFFLAENSGAGTTCAGRLHNRSSRDRPLTE